MTRVLIIEAYTDANVGSAALIENAAGIAKSLFGEPNVSILAQNKEAVEKFSGIPTKHEVFILPLSKNRFFQIRWLFVNFIWMSVHALVRLLRIPVPVEFYTFNREKRDSIRLIQESHLCISIGAERLNDNFFLALPYSLFSLWVIKSYKKKLILFPQTVGPFYFRISRFFVRKILNKCDLIYARDKKSLTLLRSLNIKERKLKFVSDIALLQKKAPVNEVKDICKKENVPVNEGKLAGVSALRWSYFKSKGGSNYEQYIQAIADACDHLIENKGYHVVFVPTNVKINGCREDDIATAREVLEAMANKNKVTLISSLYTPAQIKGIFSLMDIFIATRMHACILSTSVFTPTVSINYQFKLNEYMKLIGMEDYSLDIDVVSSERLLPMVDNLCMNKDILRSHLKSQIPALQLHIHSTLVYDLEHLDYSHDH